MRTHQARATMLASLSAAVLLAAAVFVAPAQIADAAPTSPAYLTLLFGRTQWVQTTTDCRPQRGAVPMDRVAAALATRGISATGNVVLDRTGDTSRLCWQNYTQQASWTDLANLRDSYGWSFVSAGATYANMTALTPAQQQRESCGSLQTLTAHGHDRAWGLFAYPGNATTDAIQADVVSQCFAFGRKYSRDRTSRTTGAPYFQDTASVNGGRCNNAALACATRPVRNDRVYSSPSQLSDKANVPADQWATIQFYRLVEGAAPPSGQYSWDCTSASWRDHWSSAPELYCYRDFLAVVDSIPATVTVTDPAAVAQAWGRTVP